MQAPIKRPISEAQLVANRANAKKSTGPRTESGKARSSLNAARHCLTGQVSAMTEEDRIAEAAFTAPLITDLKPATPIENQLALLIAQGHWRLNRIRAMEDNIFSLGHFGPAGDIDADDAELHGALTQAQVFLESSKAFERITLYEQRIQRGIEKNMRELEKLQATRRLAREQALEEAVKLTQLAEFNGEPAPDGFEFSTAEITRRFDRNEALKRIEWHEDCQWSPDLPYPFATAA